MNELIYEGYVQQIKRQCDTIKKIIKDYNIKNVLEIGFNNGSSSELFLSNGIEFVLSFDIGEYDYVNKYKKKIDIKYPNKHELIIGNSVETIPKYIENSEKKFDLIFIDGGHEYIIAKSDLINCKKLAHESSIVILDDTVKDYQSVQTWNIGPNMVWREALFKNFITELGSEDYDNGRGQSWGKYLFQ